MILTDGTAQAIGRREDIIPLLSGRGRTNATAAQRGGSEGGDGAAIIEA
jgi:hypothetical protein